MIAARARGRKRRGDSIKHDEDREHYADALRKVGLEGDTGLTA